MRTISVTSKVGKYFFDEKALIVIFIKRQFFGQEIIIVEKGGCQVFVGV